MSRCCPAPAPLRDCGRSDRVIHVCGGPGHDRGNYSFGCRIDDIDTGIRRPRTEFSADKVSRSRWERGILLCTGGISQSEGRVHYARPRRGSYTTVVKLIELRRSLRTAWQKAPIKTIEIYINVLFREQGTRAPDAVKRMSQAVTQSSNRCPSGSLTLRSAAFHSRLLCASVWRCGDPRHPVNW